MNGDGGGQWSVVAVVVVDGRGCQSEHGIINQRVNIGLSQWIIG